MANARNISIWWWAR
ncbi:trpE operon leader peptide TrpLE [Sinorhizobium sojae]|nr:trpE operon leader peptide TrpLE [Sinorhizobium sojae]